MPTAARVPAPGTTTLELSDLIAVPGLSLRRLAGPAGDRPVAMVQTSELDDPARYLLGDELLLTAGVDFPRTATGIDAYVRRLVAARVAALGFGVTPVYQEVPAELIAACDRHGLPLLRVPPQTPFVAVGRAFQLALTEARSRDLRRVSEAQAALASAAARPDAVEAVLRQVAARLGAWAVLLDHDGRELLTAGPRPGPPLPDKLHALAVTTTARRPAGPGRPPSAATEHHFGRQLLVHTLPGADHGSGMLALGLATDSQLGPVDRQVIGVGAVLLSLLTSPRHALGGDARGAAALVGLLLGAEPVQAAALLHPDGSWVVAHGRRRRPGEGGPVGPVYLAALGTALGTPYLAVDGDTMRALVPVAGTGEPPVVRSDTLVRLGWILGFSLPVPAAELAVADAQAVRALRQAQATGAAAAHHRQDDPGLHTLVNPAEAGAYALTRLAPLTSGALGSAALLETLRAWLSQHGNWDRTATELGVHRNTVRQRISRIAELLGADLGDADVRMELWFALRWLPA